MATFNMMGHAYLFWEADHLTFTYATMYVHTNTHTRVHTHKRVRTQTPPSCHPSKQLQIRAPFTYE